MTNKESSAFARSPRLRYPRGGRTRALSQWVLSTLVRQGARPGDKLPTEHELCRLFKVSRSTVRQALKSLDSFGLVDARPRRGSVLKAARTQDLGPLFGAVLVLSTRAPRAEQDAASRAQEARHLAHLAEARWLQERSV
ncbi:MAG: GntR family transcriptional regulator, partial [Planctomycetota bacterium]|nr:GntR family transcriptional regulator [Planctomycetota bacterium]